MLLRRALLLFVVAAALLWWPLQHPPISDHGEAREALVVRDIVAHGNWVIATRNGVLASKPPLFHWLDTIPVLIFGETAASFRAPSAVAAVAIAVCVLEFATATGTLLEGWLAVAALAGMQIFVLSALEARVDMVFSLCVTLALLGFIRWYLHEQATGRLVCYFATAAAVLAKGPAGALLVAAIVGLFLLGERDLAAMRRLWSIPLLVTALLVAGGWYVLAYREAGSVFLATQLGGENLDRFVGRGDFEHQRYRHVFKQPGYFITHLFPWSLVVFWAAWQRLQGARATSVVRFLHVWWIVVLGVFSAAAGKRSVYLLPLCPAVALLVGRALGPGVRLRAGRSLVVPLVVLAVAGNWLVGMRRRAEILGERPLLDFAQVVKRTVPPAAPLVASPRLWEGDLVFLAYALDRALVRQRVLCPSAANFLVPSPWTDSQGVGATPLLRSALQPDGIDLLHCP